MDNWLDEEGYIRTEVTLEKISPEYRAIIDEAIEALVSAFQGQIHSVYAYGSVARGTARYGDSDLDLLMVTTDFLDEEGREKLVKLEEELSAGQTEVLRGVEVAHVPLSRLFDPMEFYGHPCFLKHLCVCVAGEDLRRRYPKFRPDAAVARGFNGDLTRRLEAFREQMADPRESGLAARSAAKKLVRVGFALVMPREGIWTDDLETMAHVFEKHYPEKREEIRAALSWTKIPADKGETMRLLDTFGTWLAEEFDRMIPPTPVPDYPDAYWNGHAEFMGLDFRCDPRALVPRLETEVLVKKAGALMQKRLPDLIIDTGTGSGVIPIALAKYYGYAGGLLATDIDSDALALAGENAEKHGMNMALLACDLLDSPELESAIAEAGSVLFTANLPYVPERDAHLVSPDTAYEPRHALYSGEDGYGHIERYLEQFRKIVRKRSDKPVTLVMEMDPSHTARAATALADLGETEIFADYAGDRRFV